MKRFDEQVSKSSVDIKIWKKIFPFIKPYKSKLIWTAIMMLCAAAIDIGIPLFLSFSIDNFIANDNLNGFMLFCGFYLAVLLIQTVIVVIFSVNAMKAEMYISSDIKRSCFVHLQKLSFTYYNNTPVGYSLARLMSDTQKIGLMIAWGMVDILWAAAYLVGVIIVMYFINFGLALIISVIIPLVVIITLYFQIRMLRVNRIVRKDNSKLTGIYNEGITGAKTTKTLTMEEINLDEFKISAERLYKNTFKSSFLSAVYVPLVAFMGSIGVCLVLYYGGVMTLEQTINLGTLSVFISYAYGMLEPIQQFARSFTDFISTQANIERVDFLLTQPIDISDSEEITEKYGDVFSPKRENFEKIRGDINIDNISFKYPDGGGYVLKDFSIDIPAGTTVAIVGETGAGKSTLVNLVCRFYEPNLGKILIDGVDYKERSIQWMHSNIGYVLQSPHLFSGTIAENVAYGNLGCSMEDIKRVCKLVSADKFIEQLPLKYDTQVGEGGDMLSTGQKQLISFARAVVADPAIFVFDEATSSIDTETENLIQQAIATIQGGRTSFLIAHRLSTIRKADIILVVDNGEIIERGTHEELLEKGGYYAKLHYRQFEKEQENIILNKEM